MRSARYDRVVLVDCDIHLGYETLADLLPYLDPPTRELVINSGTNGLAMPSYPWNHPTGWIRHDVYERGDSHDANFAYLTLDTLRERHRPACAAPTTTGYWSVGYRRNGACGR